MMIASEYLASAPILITAIVALILLNAVISFVLNWRRQATLWRPDRADRQFRMLPPSGITPPD